MSDLEDSKAAKTDKAEKTGASKKRSDKAEDKTASKIAKTATIPVSKPTKPIQSINQKLLVIVDQL